MKISYREVKNCVSEPAGASQQFTSLHRSTNCYSEFADLVIICSV